MLTLFFENVELLFLAKTALHFKVIINHALSKSLIATLIKKKLLFCTKMFYLWTKPLLEHASPLHEPILLLISCKGKRGQN